jgi:hypothetical protein
MNPVGLPMLPIAPAHKKIFTGRVGLAARAFFPRETNFVSYLLSLVEKRKKALEALGETRRSA